MDPYKVLGVSPNSTDEQIKEAYTKLAKKYHPDINQNNKMAEQKMKEINAAYDMIKNGEKNSAFGRNETGGYNTGYSGYGTYGGTNGYSGETNEFSAARSYINAGYYSEALNILERMRERNARWYYYHAVSNMGLGNNIAAKNSIEEAIRLEPDNYEYLRFRESLEYRSNMYRTYSTGNYPGRREVNNPCFTMIAINFLLMLLTGGRFMWFCC